MMKTKEEIEQVSMEVVAEARQSSEDWTEAFLRATFVVAGIPRTGDFEEMYQQILEQIRDDWGDEDEDEEESEGDE